MMGIIGDNQMVDVDLRKPIFCFLVRMSDDGVGVEADYHEKVRYFFKLIWRCRTRFCWYSARWRDGRQDS